MSMENEQSALASDFRALLNSELKRRTANNDRYSLRAYARDLAVDPSDLSKILSGKRRLGPKLVGQIASKLGFSKEALDFNSLRQVENYEGLHLDSFEVISDWYHYAILELTHLKEFQSSHKYISQKLNISKEQARKAVDRLLKLGLLKSKNKGRWVDGTNGYSTTTNHKFSAPAFKNLQKGILNKALVALDDIPFEQRDQSSITVASSQEHINHAKIMIKKFRRSLNKYLESATNKDTVFNLSISLYPLTTQGKKQ